MTSPAPPEASPQSAAHLAPPSTTSFAHLITPEVIKKAKHAWCMGPLKTVQVLNTQYTIKLGPGVTNYEYRVLQFLDTLPHVPTPRPLSFFDMEVTVDRKLIGGLREETDVMETWHVIVMSTMPGQTLLSSGLDLKEGQAVSILEEVRKTMDAINTAINAGARFPDRNGDWSILRHDRKSISDLDRDEGQCLEIPLLEGLIKGQVRVDDFAKVMGPTAPQLDEKKELLNSVLNYLQPTAGTNRQTDGSSDIRFCHMDLHQGNIMVKDGALSGIIDWELAGWYTWALEVCGGLRLQRHPIQIAQYIEAWEVSSELKSVAVDARNRLKLGVREWQADQARLQAIARTVEARRKAELRKIAKPTGKSTSKSTTKSSGRGAKSKEPVLTGSTGTQ
jgi:hypothetical protein